MKFILVDIDLKFGDLVRDSQIIIISYHSLCTANSYNINFLNFTPPTINRARYLSLVAEWTKSWREERRSECTSSCFKSYVYNNKHTHQKGRKVQKRLGAVIIYLRVLAKCEQQLQAGVMDFLASERLNVQKTLD